jgi:protein ImuB
MPSSNCALHCDLLFIAPHNSTLEFIMFACIYVPDFSVEAIVRAEPLLRERAVAVLEGKPPLVRVVALNEKARLLGMEAGMTKLQADAFAEVEAVSESSPAPRKQGQNHNVSSRFYKSAVLRQRSLAQEGSAYSALLDVAHAFTPRVEDTTADTVLLDLSGLGRLYGSAAAMAGDLASRVARISVEANIALAANADAARHAARGFAGITIIPAGEEAHRLGVLPVQILLDAFEISQEKVSRKFPAQKREKLREQMLDTLERWGVRDFRMLGLLPEHALASRLGDTGVRLRRLALGEGMRTLVLCEPAVQFEEAMELECPVETIDSLSFVLNRLLEQLCSRLETRALAAQELRLRLQLERRVADEETTTVQELAGKSNSLDSYNVALKPLIERTLRLPVSMRDAKVFLKLLQLELATNPPGAPVTKIWIMAQPAPPRSAQRGLFLPITPEAEKLEITLARIKAIIGKRRAGIARLLDSHRPQSFQLDRFTVVANDIGNKQCPTPTSSDRETSSPLAMRLFRPACQLRVHLSDGRPTSLESDAKEITRSELRGKILWSAGPWRCSGEWWGEIAKPGDSNTEQAGPWDREEWDIALLCASKGTADGKQDNVALYRIYRDLVSGHWFADASYD